MQRILLITLIFSIGLSLNAQTNLDSLIGVWQDKTITDSIRVKAYHDYIWNGFLFNKPDEAIILAEDLITYAVENQYPRANAIAYKLRGLSFIYKSNYAEAVSNLKLSFKISEKSGDKTGMAKALMNIGIIYSDQGNDLMGLEYFQRSLKIHEETGFKFGISTALNNIGELYLEQGNYESALSYSQRSIKIANEIGRIDRTLYSLANIGIIYQEQGKFTEALDYLKQSQEIAENTKNKTAFASSLLNIGTVQRKQGKLMEAMNAMTSALMIYEEQGNKRKISNSLHLIGLIYYDQKNYNQGVAQCLRALMIGEEIESLPDQKNACECLYNNYKAMGKGNEALKYMESVRVLENSINSQETTKKLQQMEFAKQVMADSIATVEKERKVEMAHQEEVRQKNQTRNVLYGVSAFILLGAGGIYSRLRYVRKSKAIIEKEKDRSENLLLNILPAEIAEELKEKGKADARDFEMVSILFTDFKGFTEQSAKLSAADLVNEINTCFEAFDGIMETYGIEKIKTIGDAYMAAGGLPVPNDDSIKNTVLAAFKMQHFIMKRKADMDAKGLPSFQMRVGIHTGPVVAGIVGVKKFQYDIWGDTVNTASRMESNGEVGKVNISEATYNFLKEDSDFTFESRGKIEAKGKGEMEMFFIKLNA